MAEVEYALYGELKDEGVQVIGSAEEFAAVGRHPVIQLVEIDDVSGNSIESVAWTGIELPRHTDLPVERVRRLQAPPSTVPRIRDGLY